MLKAMGHDLKQAQCAKCAKTGCIAMCYGCQNSFCSRHFIKHRLQLAGEMDGIRKGFDTLQKNLKNEPDQHPLWMQIDAWEEESIQKIHEMAEQARADLRAWYKTKVEELTEPMNQLDEELNSNEKSDNFIESDLQRCKDKIDALREAVEKTTTLFLVTESSVQSWIRPIKLIDYELSSRPSTASREDRWKLESRISTSSERWVKMFGPCELSEDGRIVRQGSYRQGFSQVTGTNEYSSGQYSIDLFLEKKGIKNIFVGIISSAHQKHGGPNLNSSLNGWWNVNHKVINGESFTDDNDTDLILTGDRLTLTLDCNKEHIQLKPCRTNTKFCLPIESKCCPLPWKIMVRLVNEGDCLHLLT